MQNYNDLSNDTSYMSCLSTSRNWIGSTLLINGSTFYTLLSTKKPANMQAGKRTRVTPMTQPVKPTKVVPKRPSEFSGDVDFRLEKNGDIRFTPMTFKVEDCMTYGTYKDKNGGEYFELYITNHEDCEGISNIVASLDKFVKDKNESSDVRVFSPLKLKEGCLCPYIKMRVYQEPWAEVKTHFVSEDMKELSSTKAKKMMKLGAQVSVIFSINKVWRMTPQKKNILNQKASAEMELDEDKPATPTDFGLTVVPLIVKVEEPKESEKELDSMDYSF